MKNRKSVLGIDLGTSSVKVLQRYADGTVIKSKRSYNGIGTGEWWNADQRKDRITEGMGMDS